MNIPRKIYYRYLLGRVYLWSISMFVMGCLSSYKLPIVKLKSATVIGVARYNKYTSI